MDTNYIAHHGIKGMHWGIRRYQNKDGSLTPKGKARLDSYKEQESVRVKNEIKTAKRIYSHPKSYAFDRKQAKENLKSGYIELDKIKNMSFEDMRNEQKLIRKGKVYAQINYRFSIPSNNTKKVMENTSRIIKKLDEQRRMQSNNKNPYGRTDTKEYKNRIVKINISNNPESKKKQIKRS